MLNEEEAVHYHPTSRVSLCNSGPWVKVISEDDPRALTQNTLPRENYGFCQMIPVTIFQQNIFIATVE